MTILIQECSWLTTGREVQRILLVALKDGVIIGSSAIRIDKLAPDELYFESTFVDEAYRRKGVASQLNEKRLEIVDQRRAKKIWGTVYRGNRFYLRWFIAHGFAIHSKDEVHDTVRILKVLRESRLD